jgi:hypothetical protein
MAKGTCETNGSGTGRISSYGAVQVRKASNGKINPGPIKEALQKGPVSVGVAASSTAFQSY